MIHCHTFFDGKNKVKFLFIPILICFIWCADVFAHGSPAAHFCPETSNDPCEGRGCDTDNEYIGGHGHIDSYDDGRDGPGKNNGRYDLGEETSWGYWTRRGYAYTGNTDNNCGGSNVANSADNANTGDNSGTASSVVEALTEASDTVPEDNIVSVPVELEPALQTEWFHYQFYGGFNFMGFHPMPDVRTVQELWNRWQFMQHSVIYLYLDQQWLKYSGEPGQTTGQIPLSPYLPLVVYLEKGATWLGYQGVPSPERAVIDLMPGTQFVAFPEIPVGYERPSDFLSPAVCAVIRTVIPAKCDAPDLWCDNFKLIARAGDDGDYPLVDGDALIFVSVAETQIHLSTPAAPMAPTATTLTTSWGQMKGTR